MTGASDTCGAGATLAGQVRKLHGAVVTKKFGTEVLFHGVLKVLADEAEALYSDGDSETFDFKELAKLLLKEGRSQKMTVVAPMFQVRPAPPFFCVNLAQPTFVGQSTVLFLGFAPPELRASTAPPSFTTGERARKGGAALRAGVRHQQLSRRAETAD